MMNEETCARLEALGWNFVPTGPDEFEWLKFGPEGTVIAHAGDATWRRDIETERVTALWFWAA